uniref:tetraspanin-1-like n=1 Tax=Pristiophorus japonicus TaxID=55135 RepID=UPI00398E3EEF
MEPQTQSILFCMKLLMLGVNAIISVAGFVLLGFGVWVKVHGDSVLQILGSHAGHLLSVGYFCIAAGCCIAVLGVIGCWGAIKESKLLLMLFFIAMSSIFIGEIISAAVVLIFRSIITTVFKAEALQLLKNNYTGFGDKNFASYGWDSIMTTFHCCGLNNYTDFAGSLYQSQKERLYPKSCCRKPFSLECNGIDTTSNIIYTKGCLKSVTLMIKKNSAVIGGVAIAIGLIELTAIVISLMLFINLFRTA